MTGSKSGRLRDRRILIVEDDPIIALDLKGILEQEDAVVVGPANTFKKALWHLEHDTVDAAVLDVRLETENTLPLADRLNKTEIVFLFQTSDPGLVTGLYPGVPILRKPFKPEHLVAAVVSLLGVRSR